MRGIIRHDLYAGIGKQWGRMLVFPIIIGVCCMIAAGRVEVIFGEGACLSFSETAAFIFCGVQPYAVAREAAQPFEVPIFWIAVQLYTAYIIGSYPLHDMRMYGINMLIRTKSRRKWWLGKVLWTVAVILLLYLMAGLVVFLVSDHSLEHMWRIRGELWTLYDADLSAFSKEEIILMTVVFPVLTAEAMSLIQLFLMFAADAVFAYAAVGFLCIGGAFYASMWFLPSCSMILRTMKYVLNGTVWKPLILLQAACIISAAAGCVTVDRKDWLE